MDIKAIEEALRKARACTDPQLIRDAPYGSAVRLKSVCSALEEVLEYMKTPPTLPTVSPIDTKGLQRSLNIMKAVNTDFVIRYPLSTVDHISYVTDVLADLKKQIDAQTQPKDLPRWKCHKVVKAAKIVAIEYEVDTQRYKFMVKGTQTLIVPLDGFVQKHNPKPGGYYVRYEDGYESYSPAEAFESGYTPIEEEATTR